MKELTCPVILFMSMGNQPAKIHYPELRDRAHYFKKTEEGVSQMSDEFMKYVNERRDGWLTQDRKELFNISQALREGKSDS